MNEEEEGRQVILLCYCSMKEFPQVGQFFVVCSNIRYFHNFTFVTLFDFHATQLASLLYNHTSYRSRS